MTFVKVTNMYHRGEVLVNINAIREIRRIPRFKSDHYEIHFVGMEYSQMTVDEKDAKKIFDAIGIEL